MTSVFAGYQPFLRYSVKAPLEEERTYGLHYRQDPDTGWVHVMRHHEGNVMRFKPFALDRDLHYTLWQFLLVYFKGQRKHGEGMWFDDVTPLPWHYLESIAAETHPSPYREYFFDSPRLQHHPSSRFVGALSLDQLPEHLKSIPGKDWKPLFDLLPDLFTADIFQSLVQGQDEDAVLYAPPTTTSDELGTRLANVCGWLNIVPAFDWTQWDQGFATLDDPYTDYNALDAVALCKLLSAIFHRDRYAHGYLDAMIDRGTVARIVNALRSGFDLSLRHCAAGSS